MLAQTLASIEAQTLPKEQFQVLVSQSRFPYPEKLNDLAVWASGEYLLRLCDDDLLKPFALQRFLDAADQLNADLVYSNVERFGETSSIYTPPAFTLDNLRNGPVAWFTSLVRRAKWLEVGGVDEDLVYGDWGLNYKLFKGGAAWSYVPEPLWMYRVHPGQHMRTIDMAAEREAFFQHYPELRVAA